MSIVLALIVVVVAGFLGWLVGMFMGGLFQIDPQIAGTVGAVGGGLIGFGMFAGEVNS